MRIACWIPRATNTHSEYVILITLPLQQWFHERASMSRDTYTGCLATFHFHIRLCDTLFTSKLHFINFLSFFKCPQKDSRSRLKFGFIRYSPQLISNTLSLHRPDLNPTYPLVAGVVFALNVHRCTRAGQHYLFRP